MDSPPSKKAKGDTSPKAFNQSEKGEIEKPNPETSMQLYDRGHYCDGTVIQNHTRAFKLDKSKSIKRKKKEKFDKSVLSMIMYFWKICVKSLFKSYRPI